MKGTENPADLFTKYLSSPTVVEGLLAVFGCEYRGGRPAGAPELRKGAGTQAGTLLGLLDREYGVGVKADELLTADGVEASGGEVVVTASGFVFPATRCDELDGQLVAEARSYHQGVLPHQVDANLDAVFPQAEAAEAPGDSDPPCDEALEQHGLKVALCKEKQTLQGSREPLGYYVLRREGNTVSLVQCD